MTRSKLPQNFLRQMTNTHPAQTNPQGQTTIRATIAELLRARLESGLLVMAGAMALAGASRGSSRGTLRGVKPANGTGKG